MAALLDTHCVVRHEIVNTSDHEPISISIKLEVGRLTVKSAEYVPQWAWYKCSDSSLSDYKMKLHNLLSVLDIPVGALVCTDLFCCDQDHLTHLNNYYIMLKACCMEAAQDCIPLTRDSRIRRSPGWNDHVQPLKDKALFWHNIWTDMGRPREGVVARIQCATRASYHRAIRQVLRRERDLVNSKLAESLLNNNNRDFWREIKKFKRRSKNFPNIVDNLNQPSDIVKAFAESYKSLFTSVTSSSQEMSELRSDIDARLYNSSSIDRFVVNFNDVADAVHKLKHYKHEGDGTFTSDFFIHDPDALYIHLALVLSAMISHGLAVCSSTIIPIPKGRHDVCNSNNYRGIALSSILGKIIDLILLDRLQDKLNTSHLQFGFKSGHSTNICTMILKENCGLLYFK